MVWGKTDEINKKLTKKNELHREDMCLRVLKPIAAYLFCFKYKIYKIFIHIFLFAVYEQNYF